ncbi:MDIS1-interacting receptor like kinase 2-like [Populus alba]|uniref:MDIS1-interacting receptor like kinase 2-like n=1 Tax=Populus alba TaxID=43335 RepID=UPI003CC75BB8
MEQKKRFAASPVVLMTLLAFSSTILQHWPAARRVAMEYGIRPPISHRDISSKNVLLDNEFKAYLSDFGTARFLKPNSSNWTAVAGTCGYIAPALEIVMGKHPDELISTLQSSTDQQEIELKNVLDPRLPPPAAQRIEKEVVSVVMQAFSCLKVNPNFRPTMHDVTNALSKAHSHFHLP